MEMAYLYILLVAVVAFQCYSYFKTGYNKGYTEGALNILEFLDTQKVIYVADDGQIHRVNHDGSVGESLNNILQSRKP